MPPVEFIYDANCPNVSAAREQLLRAFAMAGVSATWQEWERSDSNSPDHIRHYGSPTILVNGKDVYGTTLKSGITACRFYQHPDGTTTGVPPLEKTASAIKSGVTPQHKEQRSFFTFISYFLGGLFVVLPKASCPA